MSSAVLARTYMQNGTYIKYKVVCLPQLMLSLLHGRVYSSVQKVLCHTVQSFKLIIQI